MSKRFICLIAVLYSKHFIVWQRKNINEPYIHSSTETKPQRVYTKHPRYIVRYLSLNNLFGITNFNFTKVQNHHTHKKCPEIQISSCLTMVIVTYLRCYHDPTNKIE